MDVYNEYIISSNSKIRERMQTGLIDTKYTVIHRHQSYIAADLNKVKRCSSHKEEYWQVYKSLSTKLIC